MFDDKNRSQGIQGFDEALPVEDGKDGPALSPSDETGPTAGRQQGYTVTPAGGYYSGGDDRQSAVQTESDSAAGEAKAESDMPEQAAAEAHTAQAAPSQPDRQGEYHYSASAGNIPFSGSENRPAGGAAYGSPRADGRQNGYGQSSGSYTPPQYGFMPNGTYGSQNYSSQNYGSSPYGTQPAYNSQPARPAKPPKAPRPKKERKPLFGQLPVKTFVACVLAAAVVGLGAGAGGFALTRHLTGDAQGAPVQTSSGTAGSAQTISIQSEVENLVQAVAEKVSPSVVGIRTTAASYSFFGGQNSSSGEGSGIIYSEDGYIITNYHVIQAAAEQGGGAARVQVFLPSDPENGIDASIVGYNIAYDLAVLKINQTGLPVAEIGNSDELNVGQYVVAIGNPGGLDFMGSVTYGVISGLNRKITTDNSTQLNLIQTDAAINPGNSGGALVNAKGQVIGVNSVKLVSTGYESMGFAIPMNQVVETCKQIISKENAPTPYLGIEISTKYDAQTLQMLGYPTGAVVQSVVEGSPAADAGLQRSDIITEFAGTTVSSYTTLSSAISQCSPGETVSVKVYRSGRYYTADVTLGTNNVQTAK
ncbi:MAG: serine protease [Clostridiales bacterium]|nr:serine protease [Clostridiales bacterium]